MRVTDGSYEDELAGGEVIHLQGVWRTGIRDNKFPILQICIPPTTNSECSLKTPIIITVPTKLPKIQPGNSKCTVAPSHPLLQILKASSPHPYSILNRETPPL